MFIHPLTRTLKILIHRMYCVFPHSLVVINLFSVYLNYYINILFVLFAVSPCGHEFMFVLSATYVFFFFIDQ